MKKTQISIFVVIFAICLSTSAAFAAVDDQSEDLTSVVEDPGPIDAKTLGANASTPLEAIISDDGIAEPVSSSSPAENPHPAEPVKAEAVATMAPKTSVQGAMSVETTQPVSAPSATPALAATVPVSQPSETPNPEPSAPQQPAPAIQKAAEPAPVPEKTVAMPSVLPNPFPSGLLEIEGFKYPVFLYAPPEYRPDREYPMIIVTPGEGTKPEAGIKYFKGLADRKNVFILSVFSLWPRNGAMPYQLDEWLFGIKKDIMERFPIDKDKVFIVGKDEGATYAAYLAMKYPDQFGAVALVGAAWAGQFSGILEVHSNPEKQVPFFVVFSADKPEEKQKNQAWMDKLQAKGYPIKMMEVKSSEELKDIEFKKTMFDWLDTTSQKWDATLAEKNKTWKAKVKKGVKDFFTV